MTYSIAIRTLGIAGNKYREELLSIHRQTIMPEKIIVYIAEGYKIPDFRVGIEEYVYVPKGMVSQRALSYKEIKSDCILLLDDDVLLAPNSAEKLLNAMVDNCADCVGADTFQNQDMSIGQKIYAFITNLVYPHYDKKWAFKIHRNGSFSYLWRAPEQGEEIVCTQYVAGPCAMWRKDVIKWLHWEDEMWMDKMGFAYMDDTVESYKLYVNGGKIYLHYNTGVLNLNAKTASSVYRSTPTMFYVRMRSGFCVWWRTIYAVEKQLIAKLFLIVAYTIKVMWLIVVNCLAGLVYLNFAIPVYCIKGLIDGWRFVHSREYSNIPSYRLRL